MPARPTPHPAASLIVCLALVALAAAVAGLGSRTAPALYAQLALPSWAPPAAWFGPVWTLLYALMACAAWLVWRDPAGPRGALALFALQLAANVLWSWLFFAWRTGAGAFADVLVLDALLVATLATFWRVRKLAGALLLPYLAWTLFATALNFAAWRMNPGLL